MNFSPLSFSPLNFGMTLARPALVPLALAAAALLALAVVLHWRRRRRLARFLGGTALSRLLPEGALGFPVARLVCLSIAAAALGIAAAEPRPEEAAPPPPAAPLDLSIAVDVSLSMGALDGGPSRIARAQEVVAELADALPTARIVLVVFADWPYTLVPATDDAALVRYFAQSLRADLMVDRDQGTALAAAIEQAREALEARPRAGARRVVLLVSDGGAHDDAGVVIEAARAAARGGVEVWTAGVGSVRGAELETETGPVLDLSGAPVLTRLEESLLVDVAAAGGGAYVHVGDERGLSSLVARLRTAQVGSSVGRRGPPDPTLLLALLALVMLIGESILDGARSVRHAARTGEAW
jgi:Ca-activated chloride channel family protein